MYKQIEKRMIKIICLANCLLFINGCGKKAEIITDYGINDHTTYHTDLTEVASNTISTSKENHSLSESLGSKQITWKETFSIEGISIDTDIDITLISSVEEENNLRAEGYSGTIIRDTDYLPICNASLTTDSSVTELRIVEELFGDTSKEIHGFIGTSQGDAQRVVHMAGEYYYLYPSEFAEKGIVEITKDNSVLYLGWYEEPDLYWHTYEGKYHGTEYELLFGYCKPLHQKRIAFFPKNPGTVIGNFDCNRVYPLFNRSIQEKNDFDVLDTTVYQKLLTIENKTNSSEDSLLSNARQFLECICENNIGYFHLKNPFDSSKNELVFYNKEGDRTDFSNPVINGYNISLLWEIGNQKIYSDDSTHGNSCSIWVTDQGVIGIEMNATYFFDSEPSVCSDILSFDEMVSSLKANIVNKIGISNLKGKTLHLKEFQFAYYPVTKEDNSSEVLFKPVWLIYLYENNLYYGMAVVDASNGVIIEIK